MGGALEPPSALASAAALVNNYANGIANGGLLDPELHYHRLYISTDDS
jgi:hypothetical protein